MEKDFLRAAKNGELDTLKRLVEANPALISAVDRDGSTALHCASWKGHASCVDFLIRAGADVNAHNQNSHWGPTALHAAGHGNRAEVAKLLIEAGADINALDEGGNTPLYHTTLHNATAAAKILKASGAR